MSNTKKAKLVKKDEIKPPAKKKAVATQPKTPDGPAVDARRKFDNLFTKKEK